MDIGKTIRHPNALRQLGGSLCEPEQWLPASMGHVNVAKECPRPDNAVAPNYGAI